MIINSLFLRILKLYQIFLEVDSILLRICLPLNRSTISDLLNECLIKISVRICITYPQ